MDRYDLERFRKAQAANYGDAVEELRQGWKRTHWMWYVFPQLKALGRSETAAFYGIGGIGEACAYLEDGILGPRLVAVSRLLLETEDTNPRRVMGYPDCLKLKSSMTLFENAAQRIQDGEAEEVFASVLSRFYHGRRDEETLKLLRKEA